MKVMHVGSLAFASLVASRALIACGGTSTGGNGNGGAGGSASGYAGTVGTLAGAAGTDQAGAGQAGSAGETSTGGTSGGSTGVAGSGDTAGSGGTVSTAGSGGTVGTGGSGGTVGTAGSGGAGPCGTHTCSLIGASSTACNAGLCAPTCQPDHADCRADDGIAADDGCETDLGGLTKCGTTCANVMPCAATQVCNAHACGAPQGTAVLTVPLTDTGQDQRYADLFSVLPDLTNAILRLRVFAPGATGGNVLFYVNDSTGSNAGPNASVTLDTLSKGWTDISIPVGGVVGAFDPSSVKQVTMEVNAGSTVVAWTNPTVIYLDSVVSSNLVVNDTFDTSAPSMVRSSQQTIANAMLTWTSAVP